MRKRSKYHFLLKRLPFAIVFAVVFTWLMSSVDAFEWFYRHGRQSEGYYYADVALYLTLLLTIGMLWTAFSLYKEAIILSASNSEAADLGTRVTPSDFKTLQETWKPLIHASTSPRFLFISLLIIIGAVEMLDMVILMFLPPLTTYEATIIDTAFLMLLMSPALYFIFFRPLLRQIRIREQADATLKQLTRELEKRVEQRTAQLQAELEERKQTEIMLVEQRSQIRVLSAQLALVEEQEKRRLATELHDNIGHILALISNKFVLHKKSLPMDQEQNHLEGVEDLLAEAISYCRSLSSRLNLPSMDYLSFTSAVEWLAEDILEKNGIAFGLEEEGSPDLPVGDTRILIIKVIREILVNIVKHAKAQSVEISLRTEGNDIVIKIIDDGIGFDVDSVLSVSPSDRFGIFTIRERMEYLKGRFLITSEPGRKTSVTLSIPSRNDQAEKAS